MRKWIAMISLAGMAAVTAGCSTWDNLSRAEKGAVIGAGAGAAVGSQVGDGGALNTLGGAAVGEDRCITSPIIRPKQESC